MLHSTVGLEGTSADLVPISAAGGLYPTLQPLPIVDMNDHERSRLVTNGHE
jgi:hypothetical protein